MKYLALIYGDEALSINMTEAEKQEEYAEYMEFDKIAGDRAVSGEALHPTTNAKTVRVVDGKTIITDGPFAETKEQLGGYYVLECADLDEALEVAAHIPTARRGCVEVRPIFVFG